MLGRRRSVPWFWGFMVRVESPFTWGRSVRVSRRNVAPFDG